MKLARYTKHRYNNTPRIDLGASTYNTVFDITANSHDTTARWEQSSRGADLSTCAVMSKTYLRFSIMLD
ncbi:hypothetical protein SERLA73DRAFT_180785 [Serpula lacrymans var. lacrymans S7.3]|uniref:Uncharacterized protein n=2 Tax=Serpula lacrymans var. lacrymans TaxID=341189 RepID=F8PWG0_SERL3|nr:uncharacterized protein SERLADRAFT_466540 [Serpula lacrymans var. lacrymans S7.9]EGO00284.1 hypothetical protein SERLA73DRAFT_180785 [Serpula lacrymans var. lacrymans S7.3]EGO25843.1 hypothetical protein SERLADRAFT_466540 [Serpula lacrymans var. lacrymans S7.9]